jgi:hypothetical protein
MAKKTGAPKKSSPMNAAQINSKAPSDNSKPDDSGVDSWITCADYELTVGTGANFECRFTATDDRNVKHVLDVDSEQDQQALVRDLFDALQIWPDVDIQFKSKKVGSSPLEITEIKRLHPAEGLASKP